MLLYLTPEGVLAMAAIGALDWPLRILIAGVVSASIGTGAFFLVRTSGGGNPAAVVAPVETATPTAPSLSTPTDTPVSTQPPPTAPPATATPDTRVPTLPPPPPRPEHPTPATTPDLVGGQWYRYGCADFYLPAGWTFSIRGGVSNPGGGFFGFAEESTESVIFFYQDTLAEESRSVSDPALNPALDQIAATIQNAC